jgi:hypothetical protein
MGQPTWRQVKIVTVPERGGVIWTPALDYLTPGKLYRIQVEAKAPAIKLEGSESSTAEAAPKVVVGPAEKPVADDAAKKSAEIGNQPGPIPYRPDTKEKTVAAIEDTGRLQGGGTGDKAASGSGSIDVSGGSKQLKDQCWKPESSADCTADGDPSIKRHDALLLPNGAVGALIGKIGGSAGDTDFDKDKVLLFTVGRHCVFVAPDSPKVGSLYLGMNDTLGSAGKVQNELKATIWEAL